MSRVPTQTEPDFVAFTRLWSIKDVADYLGVPIATIYQWRTKGYGPPARVIGRHLRFKPEDVHAWFEAQGRSA